ncbi:MAG: hypothetical protein ACK47B_18155 [Armatimonadota bacterium]
MTPEFDATEFARELSRSIVKELQKRHEQLREYELSALVVDCHPWHGILDLAVLTDQDEAGKWEIGEWELYPLTDSEDAEDSWSETQVWRERMRTYWQARVAESPDAAEAATDLILRACAAALSSDEVQAEISRLRLASDFELFVGNPDDAEDRNFCSSG